MTSRRMKDQATRFAVLLERLKSGEVASFDKVLDTAGKLFTELLAEAGPLPDLRRKEVEALVADFRRQIYEAENAELARHIERMEDLADQTIDFNARQVEREAVRGFNPQVVRPDAQKTMVSVLREPLQIDGDLLEPFLKKMSGRQADRLSLLVRKTWSEGLTTDEAVRKLLGTRGKRFKDGELALAKREAATAIRTSVSHVNSAAQSVFMAENSDVIQGYRWVSTLDGQTSDVCRSLDGRTYRLDDKGAPKPPVHPNCRSTIVPDLEDDLQWLSEGATRSAADGPVSDKENYYTWLKRQPKGFQEDVIGVTRTKVLNSGKLTATEFATLNLGRNFKQITLEEMRKCIPSVFDDLDL